MDWVSLKESLSDYDRRESLLAASLSTHGSVFETLRRHLLEIHPEAARALKSYLRSAAERLRWPEAPQEFEALQSDFDREWREYHHQSEQAYTQIEAQLSETVKVLQETLAAFDRGSRDVPEEQLAHQVLALEKLALLDDLLLVRKGIHECAENLTRCVEEIRRERKLAVAQLRDEIRTLQKNLAKAEHAATTDYLTGFLNRQELERVVSNHVRSRQPFTLLYIWLRNLKILEHELPRLSADRLVALASREATRLLPENSSVGRWSDDEFCAVVAAEKPEAMKISRELGKRLNEKFSVGDTPTERSVALQSRVGIVESYPDDSPERFFFRAERMMKAIQGVA